MLSIIFCQNTISIYCHAINISHILVVLAFLHSYCRLSRSSLASPLMMTKDAVFNWICNWLIVSAQSLCMWQLGLRFLLFHGPVGVTMHPLRALWEWYNIVHWTYQIQNQDVNTRYLGSHPPFRMVSKYLYSVISASYHLLCLLLWVGQLYLRFSIPYMIYIAIHKVLTYFI